MEDQSIKINRRDRLLELIRTGREMTLGQQLHLTAILSMPAIFSQLSTIIMEYVDAAMVGSLGTNASASIGLMATSTWLFWGMCSAAAMGFSVQVAHRIGASDMAGARSVLRQSLIVTMAFCLLLLAGGLAIQSYLPIWLGGQEEIVGDASRYFCIFVCFMPAFQLNFLAGSMLRCSGNTFVPGMVNIAICFLNVILNFFLIFPGHHLDVFGGFYLPGAGLGVTGAALGTGLSELTAAGILLWFLWKRNSTLNLKDGGGSYIPKKPTVMRAIKISIPIGAERILMTGAQILITVIVAPLGPVAIAANAFAVTAESLCYMPGYGISEAATTLVGQSLGAGRKSLARRFAYITVASGIVIMSVMGVVMYIGAPVMMGIITPVAEICELGIEVLRIEAWAEPMFAASIVAYGVFIGAGDTLIPSTMNLGSMWAVRLTLAALLAPTMGLQGVWVAMAVELGFRGSIFLWRLFTNYWLK